MFWLSTFRHDFDTKQWSQIEVRWGSGFFGDRGSLGIGGSLKRACGTSYVHDTVHVYRTGARKLDVRFSLLSNYSGLVPRKNCSTSTDVTVLDKSRLASLPRKCSAGVYFEYEADGLIMYIFWVTPLNIMVATTCGQSGPSPPCLYWPLPSKDSTKAPFLDQIWKI